MNRCQILKELIRSKIENERENLNEARSAGTNSPGYSMAIGAIDAYNIILSEIDELETEIIAPESDEASS